jgi:hypothetical protein
LFFVFSINRNFENKKNAFWRVDNSVGSFFPGQSESGHPKWKAYDLRNVVFGYNQEYANPSMQKPVHGSDSKEEVMNLERSKPILSNQRYQSVAQFELVWWNRGNSAKENISIWCSVVPLGCFYVGDIIKDELERALRVLARKRHGKVNPNIGTYDLLFSLFGNVNPPHES